MTRLSWKTIWKMRGKTSKRRQRVAVRSANNVCLSICEDYAFIDLSVVSVAESREAVNEEQATTLELSTKLKEAEAIMDMYKVTFSVATKIFVCLMCSLRV